MQERVPAPARNSTSADVARLAGVSRGAVSQILNGHGGRFAPATCERVLEAARALSYEPSLAGRTLARGKSDVVVAVVPHTTFGANLQDILEVMTDELSRNGLMLVTRFSTSDVTSFDGFIAAVQPVAVVTMADLADDHLDVLRSRRAPLVGAVETTDENRTGHDVIGALQARHLFDRGHRHLSYAHLKDRRQNLYGQPRFDGFRLPASSWTPGARCHRAGHRSGRGNRTPPNARPLDRHRLLQRRRGIDPAVRRPASGHRGTSGSGIGRSRQFGSREGGLPRLSTVGYDANAIARMLTSQVLSTVGVNVPSPPASPRFDIIQGGTS